MQLTKSFWETQHKNNDWTWITGSDLNRLCYSFCMHPSELHDKKILEIGVGTGRTISELQNFTNELYACDISEVALAKVSNKVKQTYITTELNKCPPVDIVFCYLVMVHCTDSEALRIINDINLTENGTAYIQFSTIVGEIDSRVQKDLIDDGSHHFRTLEKIEEIVNNSNKKITRILPPENPGGYFDYNLPQLWYQISLQNKK